MFNWEMEQLQYFNNASPNVINLSAVLPTLKRGDGGDLLQPCQNPPQSVLLPLQNRCRTALFLLRA